MVIDGTYVKPADNLLQAGIQKEIHEWNTANLNAAGLIFSNVSPTIQLFIRDALGDAKVMWKILKEKFEQTNSTIRFITVNDFLNIQKQPDESISVLIGRMDNALQRLRSSHKAELTLEAFEEELAYSTLLSALPEEFSSFRSALLIQQGDAISYEKVKTAFLQEEQARAASANGMAMRASAASSQNQQNQRRQRGNGKRSGQGSTSSSSSPPCTHPSCPKKANHSTERCFTKQKEEYQSKIKDLEKKITAAKVVETPTASITEVVESAGEASALDGTYTGTDWNADTWATRHMTPHRHWFKDYKPCRVAIRLADHKIIHSTGCGSVVFRFTINGKPQCLLEFHNVLHVPLLHSNLISVLYLVRNQRYDVTIYKSPPICIRFWRDN